VPVSGRHDVCGSQRWRLAARRLWALRVRPGSVVGSFSRFLLPKSRTRLLSTVYTVAPGLARVMRPGRSVATETSGSLPGEYDLTDIPNSGRILPSHKESFARASIVMSAQSLQRITMFDLWREFPITDASARGSAYAGGGG
jgi:hypothetical protein